MYKTLQTITVCNKTWQKAKTFLSQNFIAKFRKEEKLQPSDQLKAYISQLRKYAKNIFSPIDCRPREKKTILRDGKSTMSSKSSNCETNSVSFILVLSALT